MSEIMSPEHPQWNDFVRLLIGPERCNFHMTDKGPQWTCCGRVKPLARAILAKHFPDVDIEATIKFFEMHGGFCDSAIIFNVTLEVDELPERKDNRSRDV